MASQLRGWLARWIAATTMRSPGSVNSAPGSMIGRTSTLVSRAGNFETSSNASSRSLASIIVNPPRPSLVSANGPSVTDYPAVPIAHGLCGPSGLQARRKNVMSAAVLIACIPGGGILALRHNRGQCPPPK